MTLNNIQQQLRQASDLGTLAYNNDKSRAPYTNSELMSMIDDRLPGQQPEGEASSTDIMKSFLNGWDEAHTLIMEQFEDE